MPKRIAIASRQLSLILIVWLLVPRAVQATSVSVVGRGPLPLVEAEGANNWRYIPDFIRGSTIYSDPLVPVPNGSPTSGVADFSVTESGKIYIAAHYDYEGNSGGDWMDERKTREELLADGWSYDADIRSSGGGLFRLFEKQVTAGETFHLRVNKYTPPYVIVPTDQTGITPSAAFPWPVYGSVAVADFLPTTLDPAHSRFAVIPPALQGATIFQDIRRPSGAITDFSAVQDGTVYFAAYWGYDGNDDGDWDDYALTLDQMLAQGWAKSGQMTDKDGYTWDVVQKQVHAGDTFSIRTNKYTAPYVIVSAIPEPSTWGLMLIGAMIMLLQKVARGRRTRGDVGTVSV